MIICRLDEMIFHSAGIQSLKERFDDKEELDKIDKNPNNQLN